MKKEKQNDRVLEYIRLFGSITALDALGDLGVMRLASRISDLRRMGYNIERRMVERSNRWGEPVRVAEYRMASLMSWEATCWKYQGKKELNRIKTDIAEVYDGKA